MKPVRTTLLALLLAPLATSAAAEVTFTPFATYQWFDTDTLEGAAGPVVEDLDDGEGFAAALGYRFNPSVGLELHWGRTETESASLAGDIDSERLSVDGYYTFNPDRAFAPYVLAGIGQGRLESSFGSEVEDTIINAGVGAFWRLNENVALRLEARNVHNRDEDLNDQLALLGVQFAFGAGDTRTA
ncbi:MAG: OmpA family protein, partial [Moraxellaceae bacterium]|nr:OmpA family protein [Moraxellaceae bacterium]